MVLSVRTFHKGFSCEVFAVGAVIKIIQEITQWAVIVVVPDSFDNTF